MKKLLVVVDMQNDFIDGALGTAEAVAIVPSVVEKIKNWDGDIACTLDTHTENYLNTSEGRKLPVPHCIKGTDGWKLNEKVKTAVENCEKTVKIFEKCTFGSVDLAEYIKAENYGYIEFIGLCTDICVISNAMTAKAFVPEAEISVCAKCCAGVTLQSHQNALNAMSTCQIDIIE